MHHHGNQAQSDKLSFWIINYFMSAFPTDFFKKAIRINFAKLGLEGLSSLLRLV